MSKTTGTAITDGIVPLGSNATHYDDYGQTGFRSVGTIADRDAIGIEEDVLDADGISSGRRKAGMFVYVLEDDTIYQLSIDDYESLSDESKLVALADNQNWINAKFSGMELVAGSRVTFDDVTLPDSRIINVSSEVQNGLAPASTSLAPTVNAVNTALGLKLAKASNLSDVDNKAAARYNLGITPYIDLSTEIQNTAANTSLTLLEYQAYSFRFGGFITIVPPTGNSIKSMYYMRVPLDCPAVELRSSYRFGAPFAGLFTYTLKPGESIILGLDDTDARLFWWVMANGSVNPYTYSLPVATASVVGGIKVGSGLSVTGDGTLSANSQAAQNSLTPASDTKAPTVDAVNGALTTVNSTLNTITTTVNGKPNISDSTNTSTTDTWSAKKTYDTYSSLQLYSNTELSFIAGSALGSVANTALTTFVYKISNTTGTGEAFVITGLSSLIRDTSLFMRLDSKNVNDTFTGILSGVNGTYSIPVNGVNTSITTVNIGTTPVSNGMNFVILRCIATVGGAVLLISINPV